MRKGLPDHKHLVSRIKDVLQNEGHKEHHEMLIELFPEIYEESKRETWNNIHKVGHIYARINHETGYMMSLLMPVVIPSKHTQEPHYDTIAVFNLIAGNFWSGTVTMPHTVRDISEYDWHQLFKKMDGERLFHIGEFGHGLHNIFCQTEQTTIELFKHDKW